MLECVVNISEGRDAGLIASVASAAGGDLLDVHSDRDHHRSVLTVVGEAAARGVAAAAVAALDISAHRGVHPRLGVVDVVPFVPLSGSTMVDAILARDTFAVWLMEELDVPTFLYGAERSLPEIRRRAFRDLAPDHGPARPHPTAGATCVGARPMLLAYNIWINGLSLADASAIAASIRRPGVRALGLQVGGAVQVSMNLVDPLRVGPADAYDLVAQAVAEAGGAVARAELVGLVPQAVLTGIDQPRWTELNLSADRTIEARLAARRA